MVRASSDIAQQTGFTRHIPVRHVQTTGRQTDAFKYHLTEGNKATREAEHEYLNLSTAIIK